MQTTQNLQKPLALLWVLAASILLGSCESKPKEPIDDKKEQATVDHGVHMLGAVANIRVC